MNDTITSTSGDGKILDTSLISLESTVGAVDPISPFSSIHNDEFTKSESQFQNNINYLKQQSNKRFKDKWEDILAKYSQIDDEKESDEIDLATGEITVDNGHLRSLVSDDYLVGRVNLEGSIWSEDYNPRSDRRRIQRESQARLDAKHELKLKLKEKQSFHNVNVSRTTSPLKTMHSNIPSDTLLELSPSPTKKQRNSPTKFSSIYSKENSPISMIKRSQSSEISPSKLHLQNLSLASNSDDTGRRDNELENPFLTKGVEKDHAQVKSKLLLNLEMVKTTRATSEIVAAKEWKDNEVVVDLSEEEEHEEYEVFVPDVEKEETQKPLDIEAIIVHDSDSEQEASKQSDSSSEDESDDDTSDSELEDEEAHYIPVKTIDLSEYAGDFEVTYDFQTKRTLENVKCPFPKCNVTSADEYAYRTHLETYHAPELKLIGYPINYVISGTKAGIVPEYTTAKLLSQFPLSCNIPDLPDTSDSLPLRCRAKHWRRCCQKVFLNSAALHRHQDLDECSHRRQIFACPILGCNFNCEGKYLAWRKHIIDAKHSEVNGYRSKSKTYESATRAEVQQEIEDLFSDSELDSDH